MDPDPLLCDCKAHDQWGLKVLRFSSIQVQLQCRPDFSQHQSSCHLELSFSSRFFLIKLSQHISLCRVHLHKAETPSELGWPLPCALCALCCVLCALCFVLCGGLCPVQPLNCSLLSHTFQIFLPPAHASPHFHCIG